MSETFSNHSINIVRRFSGTKPIIIAVMHNDSNINIIEACKNQPRIMKNKGISRSSL